MTDQTPNVNPETNSQEPFIPPRYLLVLSGVGFLVALLVLLTQPSFGVVGFGGIAFGILALIAWVLMAPQEAGDFFTGRSLRYGGSSVLITVLLVVALAVIYILARGLNIRQDLTATNEFSLTDESRQAMEALAVDPTVPNVRILLFYGQERAGDRERDQLLLDQYTQVSGGKVTYDFLDIDQSFGLASSLQINQNQPIAVTVLGADGEPDVESAEVVGGRTLINQGDLTNAILRVAAQGNFVAYFLTVEGGNADQMEVIKTDFRDSLDWQMQNVSLVELTSPDGEFRLNDEARDGEVLVIPGGTLPFTPEQIEVLRNYINQGGDIVVFSSSNVNAEGVSLSTDPAFNELLNSTFGISINSDLILDQSNAYQSIIFPLATTQSATTFFVPNNIPVGLPVAVPYAHSLTISDTPPTNVTIETLLSTADTSYAKLDTSTIFAAQDDQQALFQALQQAEGDPVGPFTVGAAAFNVETGARLVVFGGEIGLDDFARLPDTLNGGTAGLAMVWAVDLQNFVSSVTVSQEARAEDTPVFATADEQRIISFISQWLLPFGILGLGVVILWAGRERRRVE